MEKNSVMNAQPSPQSILVVEDEEDILFSLHSFLEAEGYQVFTAKNGQEALSLLEQIPMPQLILVDMKMPIMSGWDFLTAWRKKFTQRCPVMVMTAAANAEDRAREVHANGWLGKPFSLDEITKKIDELIGKPVAFV